jgi:uncharacterized zinc-type alcohol dehydrogenase-like protein
MVKSDVQGYAAPALGLPLEPYTYKPPDLEENDVRVAVTHCGVCHTDLQAIDDYYGITNFPFVPGHEIVGHVSEIGANVSGLTLGDRVGIGWQGRSCGQCEWCQQGETQLCMKIEETTVMVPYGGFSTSVVADYRFVHLLPQGMPSENAAVLMCAGLTVYAALERVKLTPGASVGVIGIGGLGHLALQFANALGYEVTAISSSPAKRDQAARFGAAQFIDSNDRARLQEADYTFDLLICTANAGIPWEALFMTLKKRGTLLLLGFPDVAFNSTELVAHELVIMGSLVGSPDVMRQMLSFAQRHNITPEVECMPMQQVNEALLKIKENRARYRVVLTT